MEKIYKPQKIERKIYHLWENGGYFKCRINESKPPFVIIMPPPNTTGALHVGHAVFVTIEDILIRYYRMKGVPTLWVPGFDHAGIITQVVFEKELARKGKTRFDFTRDEFYNQVYKFSMEKKKIMESQLKRLGASCDWSRTKFTLDPKIGEAVYYTFKKMYEDGLIYHGERIINWCPRCQTALSDLEVEYRNKNSKLYFIKYPILNSNESIVVATTRPETMLGDVAVAVHPKDKRYQKFLKKKIKIILPLKERVIPLIGDERVEMKFGTGAVKITPAHDPLDFEIAKDHKLPIIKVIGTNGKMTSEAGKEYEGLDVDSCREKVLKDLKKLGFLVKEKGHQHSVATCERCGTVIEPLISKQWFIKTKDLAKRAIEVVEKKKIKIIPKHYEKIYYHWLKNIKDWCISRQIWWGHRIPVWYCKNCGKEIVEIKAPKFCPNCKKKNLEQDPNTLDTWFSSAQWPFLVFDWPKKTKDFKYFYPTTVLETGYDILFFWVARMIMVGLYCTKKIPFKYVYLHGLVRDKYGQKMSKSKGNVIDPMEIVNLYGADALRMALIFGTGMGRDIILSEEKIIAQHKFTNKIWNAARFVLQNVKKEEILKIKEKELKVTKEDKWILTELKKSIKKMSKYIENFQFHLAAKEIYHFFWHKFCDRTIEDVKKRLRESQNLREKLTAKWVLYRVFSTSLKLLHPFMPFITEALYQKLPRRQKEALIIEDWPK
jgi:valyl-tRNA synthetase